MSARIEITDAYLQSKILPEPMSGCWLWDGAVFADGYGLVRAEQKSQLAHRVVYKFYVCDPGEKCVLHKCDNRSCVNPDHLWLGTKKDNNVDRFRKGRSAKGMANGRAKLSDQQVAYIRDSDLKTTVLAGMFGCTRHHINRVKKGLRR
jgi:hypothetical protein